MMRTVFRERKKSDPCVCNLTLINMDKLTISVLQVNQCCASKCKPVPRTGVGLEVSRTQSFCGIYSIYSPDGAEMTTCTTRCAGRCGVLGPGLHTSRVYAVG